MTLPALAWQDRWGRRPTMLVGAFFMCIFMFAKSGIMSANGVVVPSGIQNTPEESMRLRGPAATSLIACTYLGSSVMDLPTRAVPAAAA